MSDNEGHISFRCSADLVKRLDESLHVGDGRYQYKSEYYIEFLEEALLYKHSLATVNAPENNLPIPSTVPFETEEQVTGTAASQHSVKALTSGSVNSKTGKPDITQFSERQQLHLRFEAARLELRVKAVRAIEEEKRETNRQAHFRRPQQEIRHDEPLLKQPCPEGHNTLHCSTTQCDRRGQCRREGVLGELPRPTENPEPFTQYTA